MAEFETFRRRSAEERLNYIHRFGDTMAECFLFWMIASAMEFWPIVGQGGSGRAALIYNKLLGYLKTKGLRL